MTRVFAHRGAAHQAPENSIEAFVDARRLGADGVELDVRVSVDGAFVVHHDAQIDAVGPIASARVVDLPQAVPLLSEALEACQGMTVNVEIKNDPNEPGFDPTRSVAAQVAEEILELFSGWDILISSFDFDCLRAVQRVDPTMAVGYLLGFGVDPFSELQRVVEAGVGAIHPFVLGVTKAFVDTAHGEGIAVNTWTVNAAHDLEKMQDFGVDVVITDDVALARTIIKS